ncbi:MAG: hypothetical protein Q8Q90_03385 [bacterium]|nr:hypothetical protein [bacterium]
MKNFFRINFKNIKLAKLAPYLIFTVAVLASAFIFFSGQATAQEVANEESPKYQLLATKHCTSSAGYYCSGSQRRYRFKSCSTTLIQNCTYGCSNGACNSAPSCSPTNATWSGWTDSSSCTQSCGGGTKTQSRTCQGTASCGGTNYCTGSSTQTVSCNTQACYVAPPTVSISASPSTISYNTSSTISWSSSGASSCSASGAWSGSKGTSGSQSTGNLTSGQTYSISCSNSGGSASSSVTVNVNPPAPTVSISVSPTSITQGSAATLSWSSSNSSSCSVTNVGGVQPNMFGATTVRPNSTTSYTISCSGSGGSNSSSATLTVTMPPPTNVNIKVSSSGNSGPYVDGPLTAWPMASIWVNWTSSGASSCTLNGSGVGTTSGGTQIGSLGNNNRTWTLSCSNSGGSTSDSVTVNSVPQTTADVKANNSDSAITVAYNSSASISWSSTNASSGCIASGAWSGPKSSSGSQSTGNLTSAQTYTLSCSNGGGSVSDSITVNVSPPVPTADIKANNSDGPITISYNASATLTWSSTNASSCSISPSGLTGTSGSQSTGNLTTGTTYTLNCTGAGGSASNTVTVNVSQPPSPTANLTVSDNPNGGFGSSVSISYNTAAYLKWSSTNANSCSVSIGGWTGTSNSSGQSTGNLTQSRTYTLSCTGAGGTSATDSVTVNVAAPSLGVNFSVSPTSGNSPVDTTFSSSVTGQAIGTINYNYWWNCGYNGTSVAGIEAFCGALPQITPGNCATNANGYRCVGVNTNPQSTTHQYTCASGTCNYNAKVIIERGSASAVQQIIPVSVSLPNLSASCTVDKSIATVGERATWGAVASGGNGTYSYSWGGSTPLSGASGSLVIITGYSTAGTKIGNVTVTSGSQTRTVNCSNSVTVYAPAIKILPSSSSSSRIDIAVDDTRQLVTEYYPYGLSNTTNVQNVTNSAGWGSGISTVVTVNNSNQKGLITGESVGTGNINAGYTDVYGNSLVTSTSVGTSAYIRVNSQPSLSCSPFSSSSLTGQNIIFTAVGGSITSGYNWTAAGGSPSSGNGSNFTTKFNASGTYNVVVRSGSVQTETCTVIVSSPSLTITDPLILNPSPGNAPAPVNGVDISAAITSNITSPSNFTFYCNRSDAGTNITSGYAAKYDGVSASTMGKTAVDACNYTTPGTYTAKVIVERGGAVAERRSTFVVLQPVTVDIKADSSDGPIAIDAGTSATLSWRTTNATSCTASGGTGPNWSGSKSVAESTSVSQSTGILSAMGTYRFTITCDGPNSQTKSDYVDITVNASLSITSFTVSPAGKASPGSGNNMSVSISSNILGVSNNYTFYCNKSGPDSDTVVTGDWTHKKDGENSMSYGPPSWPCYYTSPGTYTAKVIVERGGISRAAHVDITIAPNVAPSVSAVSPSAPSNYCVAPFGWTVSWNFSDANGDTQYAYQVVITDQAGGGTVKDTGQVVSSSSSYTIPLSTLDFNKTYNWQVTVWESDTARLSASANGSSFTTIKHAAPALSFSILPLRPSKDEQVVFTDTTTVSGGATKTAWNWDFSGADGVTVTGPTNASTANASFSTPGAKNIVFRVTDSDGLTCEKGSNDDPNDGMPNISIGRSIPSFKEIIPR